MKRKSKIYIIRLGIFSSIGTLLLILAVYFIGQQKNLFNANININSTFNSIHGLKIGSNVRLTGVNVGVVNKISILSDTSVRVGMLIDKDVVQFIKKDSKTTIGTDGLMGNKIINILPGSQEYERVEQGDHLLSVKAVEIDDILSEVKASTEKITGISQNLIEITDKINRGEGVFGKIFTDTTFTKNLDKTSSNITTITRNLIEISDRVNEGKGILGKLMVDTMITKELDKASKNLSNITQNIEDITFKINHGEGIFGRLFVDTLFTNNIYQASKNLVVFTENLDKMSNEINAGEGTLTKLLNDSIFADSLDITLKNLNDGIKAATEAANAIERSGLIRMFSKDEEDKK